MVRYEGPYVALGKTGLKVSRLAFGCGFRGIYDKNEAAAVIAAAIERGINFIDCANIYRLRSGIHAEEALGMAIKGRRDEVVITSKYGGDSGDKKAGENHSGASRYHIVQAIDETLRRIGTDHIDIYLLHMPDDATSLEETVTALDMVFSAGKIRYAGLCNHPAWKITAMQEFALREGLNGISVLQNPYNLLNRSVEQELLPVSGRYGMGVMTYSPLAAGLLGGMFAKGGKAPEKSTWGYNADYAEFFRRVFPGRIETIVNTVADIAARYGATSAQVATAWVMQNEHITSAITGADSVEELEDSLRAFQLSLSADDLETLQILSDGMREEFAHPQVEAKLKTLRFQEARIKRQA